MKDLITKPVTIHVTADAQMRRLPERMATMLATLLKGSSNSQGQAGGSAQAQSGGQWQQHGGATAGGSEGWGHGRGAGGDMQQMLSRAPAIALSDLKKGEAVMLVSTEGTTDVTAITLVAGVEPLLEAPAGRDLLANWSMDSGGGAAEAATQ